MTLENGGLERHPRVLLVEDDAATRELLTRHLSGRGFNVTAVDAAEEGIVEASDVKFDVVVADVHLPGLSGTELANFMVSHDPALPVILMTGDADEQVRLDALAHGASVFLYKPFEVTDLEKAVRQALIRRGWTSMEGSAQAAVPPQVPSEWLEFVDHESYAGPGHGERVARVAQLLLEAIPLAAAEIAAQDLMLAARTHEVGRLRVPDAEPAAVASQSAELMAEAKFPRMAVRAVRHMHERWDGSGGPDGLSASNVPLGALVLAVADALDHYVSAWVQAGLNGDNAVDRAIHLVSVQQGEAFSPVVVGAVHRSTEAIREVCAQPRPVPANEALTTASFTATYKEAPFQVA